MFNSKKDVSDEQNERHKRILTLLLKQEGNKQCADCKTRNPTWASVNLGVFVCLTCSGIHRSLGVHISQVRSCNLDTWLPRQVEFMKHMGNVKASVYWEAQLPGSFRRPPGGNPNPELGQFIRAKYEERRYAAADAPPPNIDNYMEHPYVVGDKAPAAPEAAAAPPPAIAAAAGRGVPVAALAGGALAPPAPAPAAPKAPAAGDLLGFDAAFDELAAPRAAPPADAAASSSPLTAPAAPAAATAAAAADPFSSLSDDWSDFASAAPAPASAAPAPVSAPATPPPAAAATAAVSPTSSPLAAAAETPQSAAGDPFASLPGHDLIASMQGASISTPSNGPAAAQPPQQQLHGVRPATKSAEDIMKLFDRPGARAAADPFSSSPMTLSHSGSPTAHLRHPHAPGYSSAPNLNGLANGAALPAGAFTQQVPGYVMPQQQPQQHQGLSMQQQGQLAPQPYGGIMQPPQGYAAGIAAKGTQVAVQPGLVGAANGTAALNFNFAQF